MKERDNTENGDRETAHEPYEPPAVEDLDTAHGPATTPAGVIISGGAAPTAPRELS